MQRKLKPIYHKRHILKNTNQHLAQDVFRQQCDKEGLEHQLESNSRLNRFVKIFPQFCPRTMLLVDEYYSHDRWRRPINCPWKINPLYFWSLLFHQLSFSWWSTVLEWRVFQVLGVFTLHRSYLQTGCWWFDIAHFSYKKWLHYIDMMIWWYDDTVTATMTEAWKWIWHHLSPDYCAVIKGAKRRWPNTNPLEQSSRA